MICYGYMRPYPARGLALSAFRPIPPIHHTTTPFSPVLRTNHGCFHSPALLPRFPPSISLSSSTRPNLCLVLGRPPVPLIGIHRPSSLPLPRPFFFLFFLCNRGAILPEREPLNDPAPLFLLSQTDRYATTVPSMMQMQISESLARSSTYSLLTPHHTTPSYHARTHIHSQSHPCHITPSHPTNTFARPPPNLASRTSHVFYLDV